MENLFYNDLEVNDLFVAKKIISESINGFMKFIDSSPVCISITTPDRVYVKVNKNFLDIFGYSESEIIGRTSVEIGILDPEESKKVGNIYQLKGKLQNDIVKCIAKDGREIYTVSSIENIEINQKIYMMSSFLDITKINEQQQIIEKQYKEIIESINYASIIQNSILPNKSQIDKILPDSFVLFKPKNIVSGDFYWIKEINGKIFVAACDCTGHGVPGALISIIGVKLLNKFITEYHFSNPAAILNQLNKEFIFSNKYWENTNCHIKDGMDIALCVIDKASMTMEYAGAYNPVYIIRTNRIEKLPVDKIPIHLFSNDTGQEFRNHHIQLEKNDVIYLFSDGYADQFGGPRGKKFNYSNFQELILSIHHLPMSKQSEILNHRIEEWRGISGDEQTDDILIFGFKIK